MPLILEVSWARKIGLPEYGSLGATCGLKLEVDPALLAGGDTARLRAQLAQAYGVCAAAVDDELRRRRGAESGPAAPQVIPAPTSGTPAPPAARNGHGRITPKQVEYARQLAAQIDRVGLGGLSELAQRMFARPLEDLSSLQASSLIQTLKQLKSGQLELAEILPEVAA